MTESTWTAPAVERRESPNVAPERVAVEGLLDHHRATLLWKCAGLTGEQLKARSVPPSTMSLLGLLRHLTDVERVWFRERVAQEPDAAPVYWSDASPDGDFDDVDGADPAADYARYVAEVEAARAVMAGRDLDETFVNRHRDGTEEVVDLRALMLHMVEEYARHNGHADLLRQAVDGATGE